MATTYNFTDGSISGQPKVHDTLPNTTGLFVRSNIVDFANQNLDSGENDIAKVINVPADTWVLMTAIRVLTAETANSEILLGSGLDYDQWGILVATATGNVATTQAPEYFADADTIDITNNNNDVDFDALKVEVIAVMCPGNKADTDGESQHST
jgi:hypothetical protein